MLAPGSPVVCSEVLNATFFVDPYSPDTLRYWTAFNEQQLAMGGDPFVGAKLGNLLERAGFREVVDGGEELPPRQSRPRTSARSFSRYWSELLLSGAPALLDAKKVDESVVDGMREELARVARDPNSVFFYSFIQARARA